MIERIITGRKKIVKVKKPHMFSYSKIILITKGATTNVAMVSIMLITDNLFENPSFIR